MATCSVNSAPGCSPQSRLWTREPRSVKTKVERSRAGEWIFFVSCPPQYVSETFSGDIFVRLLGLVYVTQVTRAGCDSSKTQPQCQMREREDPACGSLNKMSLFKTILQLFSPLITNGSHLQTKGFFIIWLNSFFPPLTQSSTVTHTLLCSHHSTSHLPAGVDFRTRPGGGGGATRAVA